MAHLAAQSITHLKTFVSHRSAATIRVATHKMIQEAVNHACCILAFLFHNRRLSCLQAKGCSRQWQFGGRGCVSRRRATALVGRSAERQSRLAFV